MKLSMFLALSVSSLAWAACGGRSGDECKTDEDCQPGEKCESASRYWCDDIHKPPPTMHCYPEDQCLRHEDCEDGYYCNCVGYNEIWGCCHGATYYLGTCSPCNTDTACGPACINCYYQDTNRACVDGACGCRDAESDCLQDENCVDGACVTEPP